MDHVRQAPTSCSRRAQYLPASTRHLDVADTNLQMALLVVAAPDESRIQADADGRRRGPGCRAALNVALLHSVWNAQSNGIILARSNSTLARPYMARFSVFNRLI